MKNEYTPYSDDALLIPPFDDVEHWQPSPSGLLVPRELSRARVLYGPKRIGVDLFCGCGGFSLGLMQAGFRIVAAVENDATAALTYTLNLGCYPLKFHFPTPADEARMEKCLQKSMLPPKGHKGIFVPPVSGANGNALKYSNDDRVPHFWLGDIRQISGAAMLDELGLEPGDIDVVCGGPPCQGFSTANSKRSASDRRNNLVFEFMRLVCELQPKTFIMENVPGLLQMKTPEGMPVLDAICLIAEEGGFGTYDGIRQSLLGTSGAGVAVRRKNPPKKTKKPKRRKAA